LTRLVKPEYDSLWYFHPFSIDLLAGVWTPLGKLSEYYNPSAKFGGSLGIMVGRKMRFQLWMMPIFFSPKKTIGIKVNDTIVSEKKTPGASIGGWLSYTFLQNKQISAELISGVTWEDIDTGIENPKPRNKYDSILDISSIGISFGVNTWVNIFRQSNTGIRVYYTYATYDKSKIISHSIGGHSMTISLVYRFPKRSLDNKRYY